MTGLVLQAGPHNYGDDRLLKVGKCLKKTTKEEMFYFVSDYCSPELKNFHLNVPLYNKLYPKPEPELILLF